MTQALHRLAERGKLNELNLNGIDASKRDMSKDMEAGLQ